MLLVVVALPHLGSCSSAPLQAVCGERVAVALSDLRQARGRLGPPRNFPYRAGERQLASTLPSFESDRDFWTRWALERLKQSQNLGDELLLSLDPQNANWRRVKVKMNRIADRWVVVQGLAQQGRKHQLIAEIEAVERDLSLVSQQLCEN